MKCCCCCFLGNLGFYGFGLHVRGLVPQILEQGRGEVALTEAGDDDDDALAGILRSAADPDGGRDGGCRGC